PAHRRRDAGGNRVAGPRRAARLRLRADSLRGHGCGRLGRHGLSGTIDQDGTIRSDRMKVEDMKLDGNAIGGLLLELFGTDLTGSMGVCASCGVEGQVATLDVYVHAPGVVGRCRSCGAVRLCMAGRERGVWVAS